MAARRISPGMYQVNGRVVRSTTNPDTRRQQPPSKPQGLLGIGRPVQKGPMPIPPAQPQPVQQRPVSMGQGDNYFPGIQSSNFAQQAQMRGDVSAQPSAFQNPGRYAGFESNYFPEAKMNMPQSMNAGKGQPQGMLPNTGMAQGNPDNFFPEAKINSPWNRKMPMASIGSNPQPTPMIKMI